MREKRGGCTYNPDGKSIIHDETIIVIPGESTETNVFFLFYRPNLNPMALRIKEIKNVCSPGMLLDRFEGQTIIV